MSITNHGGIIAPNVDNVGYTSVLKRLSGLEIYFFVSQGCLGTELLR